MGGVIEVRFEIGRRNLDPEGSLAHLALAEVAEQRQQRPDLAAFVCETNPIEVFAPLACTERPDLLQVEAPVPTADHIGREGLPGQNRARLVRFQVRAQRHACPEEPRRRSEAYEVVAARLGFVWDADLPRLSAQLRPEQR